MVVFFSSELFYFSHKIYVKICPRDISEVKTVILKLLIYVEFMVARCINNIKHFIVQLMHTNYKILRLLK